jgi:hypothetical protein
MSRSEIDQQLREAMGRQLLSYCQMLIDHGFTRDEVNVILEPKVPDMNKCYADAWAQIMFTLLFTPNVEVSNKVPI